MCIQKGYKILQTYRLPDKTKNMDNVTVEIPLEDKARGTNRHISICFGNLGKNDYTTVKVNSVKVSYPEYSYVINNDSVEDQNSYVEQWYGYAGNQAPGDAESKKRIKLGELKFASASNDAGNELRLRKTSSNVGFAPVQYSGGDKFSWRAGKRGKCGVGRGKTGKWKEKKRRIKIIADHVYQRFSQ